MSGCPCVRDVGPSGPSSDDVVEVDPGVGTGVALADVLGRGARVGGADDLGAGRAVVSSRSTGPAEADVTGGSGASVTTAGRATHIPPASVPIANGSARATAALWAATVAAEPWLIQCCSVSQGCCSTLSVLAGTPLR
jgi:hypothetical protein